MFDTKNYIHTLESIRKDRLMSKAELAHELGITYGTLMRVMDPLGTSPLSNKTMRAVRDFINTYKKES